MRRFTIAGVLLLAACGGTEVAPATTTSTTSTTTTTTTTVAPTTTVDRRAELEIAAIDHVLDAGQLAKLCLLQLQMRDGGLPEEMIIEVGIDALLEGSPHMSPEGQEHARELLWRCFR